MGFPIDHPKGTNRKFIWQSSIPTKVHLVFQKGYRVPSLEQTDSSQGSCTWGGVKIEIDTPKVGHGPFRFSRKKKENNPKKVFTELQEERHPTHFRRGGARELGGLGGLAGSSSFYFWLWMRFACPNLVLRRTAQWERFEL